MACFVDKVSTVLDVNRARVVSELKRQTAPEMSSSEVLDSPGEGC